MSRRSPTTTVITVLQRLRRSTARTLSTADGRWAVLSTSLTALIAGSVAWLAVGTNPADIANPQSAGRRALLPYELFLTLTNGRGDASYASIGPGGLGGASGAAPTDLDAALHAERNGDTDGIDRRTIALDPGDTLVGALTEAGVTIEDANAAVLAMADTVNPRALRAGQSFDVDMSEAADDQDPRLLAIRFSPSVEQDVTISRAADGSYAAKATQKKLIAHTHRAGATIDSSLYLTAMQAGVPADVVVEMIRMFSYKVDFQRDIHPGDAFEVYYDYFYTPEGKPAKQGDISFARMTLGDQEFTLYRFQRNEDEPAEYYDAKGQSAKGLLMKTPVDGARISSGFGARFHPVLGYTRMHKGIDFAVPKGTPVMAAGSGVVTYEGVAGGYGNFLKISHGEGYSTGYAHLSRFAPGVKRGSHVRQGQIVAYSGMTGLATGPHLHYEIFKGSTQVNPLKVKMAEGHKLAGNEMKAFQTARATLDRKIAALPLEKKVADISTDLRQAKAE